MTDSTRSAARRAGWTPRSLIALAGILSGVASPAFAQDKAQPVTQPGGRTGLRGSQPGRNSPPGARPNQPGNQPGRNQPNNPNQPVTQPGGESDKPEEKHEVPNIDAGDGMIEFSGFAEPVDLTTLVEIVAQTLKINIYSDPNLSGSIVFNAPVRVKKENLLDMLRAFLELSGYGLSYDERTGFYAVGKNFFYGDQLSTKVFVTEGIRPSSLKSMIDSILGPGGGSVVGGGANKGNQRGQPQQPQGFDENGQPIAQPVPGGGGAGSGTAGGKIVYNDELGVVIMVDTTRRIDQVSRVIDAVLKEYAKITVTEIGLKFVAPGVAKQRILEMLGQAPQTANRQNNRGGFDEYGNPMQQQGQPQSAAKTNMDNLAERLTVSPNGNSLFFRGKHEELDLVTALITKIDVQSRLEPRTYTVGASAKAVADIARQRGMGEVTTIKSTEETRAGMNFGYYDPYQQNRNNQNQSAQLSGGPVMVVDEGRGQIIFYATEQLHVEMERLIDEIAPEDDAIVMRDYRLTYAKAETLAGVILGLINNQAPAENNESGLLPGGANRSANQPIIVTQPYYAGNNDLSISGKNSFVIADKANNQVIVKAPLKEQPYYRDLINRLDLPVPQVYIEAQIVAVTGSDDFRLAFETQLINANGTGGVVNTNFGLSSFGTGTGLTGRKTVATGLRGITGAVIKSDQVPIVLNALRTQTESRILSSPKLLVDANTEEASVESNDQQPIAQQNFSNSAGGTDTISFGGYEDAGTKLIVKDPQIGPGDGIRMAVEIELSSFTGEASGNLPPPKQKNTVKSQVQVPANMTVVIGGVVIDSKRDTVDKIPLLGDIPLLGFLFQDQNRFKSNTTLYVFITPRVQRDPNFRDANLFTLPAKKAAGISDGLPEMKPVLVDFLEIKEPTSDTSKPASAPTKPDAGS